MKIRLIFFVFLVIACLFTGLRCFNHLNAWLGFVFIAIAIGITVHETIYHIKNQTNEKN